MQLFAYQGRYKSFPDGMSDEHFWVVVRSSANALRHDLVSRAVDWRRSRLWRRCHGTREEQSLLPAWTMEVPPTWVERVDRAVDGRELEALPCVRRRRPVGRPDWRREIATRLSSMEFSLPSGRGSHGRSETIRAMRRNGGLICLNCHKRTCPGFSGVLTSTKDTWYV